MLSTVVEIPVIGGARPLPVATVSEKLDHDAGRSAVGQLKGRIAAVSRLYPCPDDQQKSEKDRCQKFTQGSLP